MPMCEVKFKVVTGPFFKLRAKLWARKQERAGFLTTFVSDPHAVLVKVYAR